MFFAHVVKPDANLRINAALGPDYAPSVSPAAAVRGLQLVKEDRRAGDQSRPLTVASGKRESCSNCGSVGGRLSFLFF